LLQENQAKEDKEELVENTTDQDILKSIEQVYFEDEDFDPARYELKV